MTTPLPISIVTHTRNSARTLPRLLETTAWAGERLVVDMASTDETRAIAQAAGCRVMETPLSPVVDSVRNAFFEQAENEWIFVLDSDEYLAVDAPEAIGDLLKANTNTDVFSIPRYNYIAAQVMRGSGWYPDHQTRLFRQGTVRWQDGHHRPPTISVEADRHRILEPPHCLHIHHQNYAGLSEVIEKQLRYALTDRYETEPEAFDFHAYLGESLAELKRRFDPGNDGDLSSALATVMAWDRIMRGLIHWDRLGRTPSLQYGYSLPVIPEQAQDAIRALAEQSEELRQLKETLRRTEEELAEIRRSRFRWLRKQMRSAGKRLRGR